MRFSVAAEFRSPKLVAMVENPEPGKLPALRIAGKLTGPVGMGYVPLGFAYGAFAVTQGFPVWLTIVSAACIYAGSMEFTAVNLILGGVDLVQTVITAFFVNFRHIFYGLAFPLHRMRSGLARAYGIQALTDEAYALVVSTLGSTYLSGSVIFFIQLLCHLYWVSGVTLGALVGNALPFDTSCLSFALPALFITLAIDAYKQSQFRFLGAVAAVWGLLALLFFRQYMLLGALSLFSATVVLYLLWGFRRHPDRINTYLANGKAQMMKEDEQ